MSRKKVTPENRKKGEYGEYKRERERINKKQNYCLDRIKKGIIEINNDVARNAKKDFFELSNIAISNWYDSYEPNKYIRKYGLRKVPDVDVNIKMKELLNYTFVFDSQNIIGRHRIKNKDYLYINSFVHGWHGGADLLGPHPAPGYEMPHPQPRTGEISIDNETGVPYWRWPSSVPEGSNVKRWQYWSDSPAARSKSPYDYIMKAWPPIREQYNKEIKQRIQKLILTYVDIFKEYLAKYKRW